MNERSENSRQSLNPTVQTSESLDTVNCTQCIVRRVITGTGQHPYWLSPSSRTAHLSHVSRP